MDSPIEDEHGPGFQGLVEAEVERRIERRERLKSEIMAATVAATISALRPELEKIRSEIADSNHLKREFGGTIMTMSESVAGMAEGFKDLGILEMSVEERRSLPEVLRTAVAHTRSGKRRSALLPVIYTVIGIATGSITIVLFLTGHIQIL